MGVVRQFGALLWKNCIARKRHPVLFLLEIILPIIIFVAVGLMRRALPPDERHACSYGTRALPSAGMIPFLQSSVCTLENPCVNETARPEVTTKQLQFRSLLADLGPTLEKTTTLKAMKSLPTIGKVFKVLKDSKDRVNLTKLDDMLKLRNMVRDPEVVHDILVVKYGVLSSDNAYALLDSSLNPVELMGISTVDWKGIVCDPELFQKYVFFKKEVDVKRVSTSLCAIKDDDISKVVNDIAKQLNIKNILEIAEEFASMTGEVDFAQLLDDMGKLMDMFVGNSKVLTSLDMLQDFQSLPRLFTMMRDMMPVLQGMEELDLESLGTMYEIIKPLLSELKISPDVIEMLDNMFEGGMTDMMDMFKDPANIDWQELMGQLGPLSESLGQIPNFNISEMSAPSDEIEAIITGLITNGSIEDQGAMNRTLAYMEDMMKQMMGPEMMNMMMYVSINMMDNYDGMMAMTSDLRDQVVYNVQNNSGIRTALNMVSQLDPDTAQDFLMDTVSVDNIYGMITNELDAMTVCNQTAYSTLGDTMVQADMLGFVSVVCQPDVTSAVDAMFDMDKAYNDMQQKMVDSMNEMKVVMEGGADPPSYDVTMADMYYRMMDMMTTMNAVPGVETRSWEVLLAGVPYETMYTWMRVWTNVNEQFGTNTNLFLAAPVIGESMEKSSMWELTKVPLTMGYAITDALANRAKRLDDMAKENTIMAQMVHYLEYLPEFAMRFFEKVDQQKLMMSGSVSGTEDILAILCDQIDWNDLDLSASVPADEMKTFVCKTDWTSFMQDMIEVMEPLSIVAEVERVYLSAYDDGIDWLRAASNIQSIRDMFMGDFTSLLYNLNIDTDMMWSALETAMSTMNNMTMESAAGDNLQLSTSMLVTVDQMLSEVELWKRVKHYCQLWIYWAKSVDEYEHASLAPGFNRTLYLRLQSPTLEKLYSDMKELFPTAKDFLQTENIQIMIDLMTANSSASCDHIKDSSKETSNAAKMLELLCETDWEAFNQELETGDTYLAMYMSQLQLVMEPTELLPPISVNWTDLILTSERVMQKPTEDLLEHAALGMWEGETIMDELNMLWSELNQTDFNNLLSSPDTLVSSLLYGGGGTPALLQEYMASQLYLQYHVQKFMIRQLEYFNSTAVVDLKAYMNSPEAHKMLDVFSKSPDLPNVVFETIKSAIYTNKLSSVNLEQVCNMSSTAFSDLIVVPDNTTMTVEEIQELACGVHVDFGKMIEELRGTMIGLDDMMNAIEKFDTHSRNGTDYPEFNISYTMYQKDTEYFSTLLDSLIRMPPSFVIMGTPVEDRLQSLMTEIESLLPKIEQDITLEKYLQNMMVSLPQESLDMVLGDSPEMHTIWTVATVYTETLHNMVSLGKLFMMEPGARSGKYPEMQKVWELMDWLPEIFYTYSYTSDKDQLKVAHFLELLSSGTEAFCMVNPADLMTVPPDSDFDFAAAFNKFCALDMEALAQEMDEINNMNAISQAYAGNSTVDTSTLSSDIDALVQSIMEFINGSSSWYMPRFLNETLWEETMMSVLGIYMPEGNTTTEAEAVEQSVAQVQQQMQQQLASMQDTVPELNAMFKIANMYMKVMDRMVRILQGTFMEDDELLQKYPNVKLVWSLMPNLPDVAKTFVYTSIVDNNKIMHVLELAMNGTDRLCQEQPDKLMTDVPGGDFSFGPFFNSFCAIDFQALTQESLSMNPSDISETWASLDFANTSSSIDAEKLFADMDRLMANFTDLFMKADTIQPPAFLSEEAWADVLNLPLGTNSSSLVQVPSSTDMLDEIFGNETAMALATMNVVLEQLIQESKGGDSALNVSEIVTVLESLGNLTSLLESASSGDSIDMTKLEALMEKPDDVVTMCERGTLAQHITQEGRSMDLGEALQELICVSPKAFAQNLKAQQLITDIWMGTADAEWYSLRHNLEKMGSLVEELTSLDMWGNNTEAVQWLDQDILMDFIQSTFTDPKIVFSVLRAYTNGLEWEGNSVMTIASRFMSRLTQRLIAISKDDSLSDPVKLLKMLNIVSSADEWLNMLGEAEFKYALPAAGEIASLQGLVCDVASLQNMAPYFGEMSKPVSEVSKLLCGQPGSQWYEILVQNGWTYNDMDVLTNIFEAWSSQTLLTPESWDEILDRMSEMADSISNLDFQNFLSDLTEEDLMNTGLEVATMANQENIQMLFSLIYTDADNAQMIQIMELVSEYLTLMENRIDGRGILSLMLPDIEPVTKFLDSLMGDQNIASVMVATVDPEQFWTVWLEGRWSTVVCNPGEFRTTFTFPEGTDVTTLQKDLCKTAGDVPALSEFLGDDDGQAIMNKLEEIMAGQGVSTNNTVNSIMTQISEQITRMIENDEILEKMGEELGAWLESLGSYLSSSTSTVTNQLEDTSGLMTACDGLVGYIEGTEFYKETMAPMLDSYLWQIQVSTDVIQVMLDTHEIACVKDKEMVDILKDIQQSSIPTEMKDLAKMMTGSGDGMTHFTCSGMAESYKAYMDLTTFAMTKLLGNDSGNAITCIGEMLMKAGTVMEDAAKLQSISDQMSKILEDPQMKEFIEVVGGSSDAADVFQEIVSLYTQQQKAQENLQKLLTENMTSLMDFIETSFNLGRDTLNQFMEGSVNLNLDNMTAETLIQKVCEEGTLDPEFGAGSIYGETLGDVRASLCGDDRKMATEVADYLIQLSRVANGLQDVETDDLVGSLSDDISALLRDIEGVSDLAQYVERLGTLDFENLDGSTLSTLQRLLLDKGPDRLLESLNNLLDNFATDEMSSYLVDDMKMLAEGLFAFKSLRHIFMTNVKISDMVSDQESLKRYLIREVKIPPDVATAVVEGALSFEMLLEAAQTDITDWVCDPDQLAELIKDEEKTGLDVVDLSRQFCSLDTDTVAAMMDEILNQLDVGDLLQELIVNGIGAMMREANTTVEDTKDALVDISIASEDLTLVFEHVESYLDNVPNAVQALTNQRTGDLSYKALSELICGDPIPDIDDQMNLGKPIKRKGLSESQRKEMQELPGQECQNLYADIMAADVGPIVWGYLKPLLRGKILFAPDTPLTRSIVTEINSTFASLEDVYVMSRDWASGVASLKDLMADDGASEIQEIFNNTMFKNLLASMSGSSVDDLEDVVYRLNGMEDGVVSGLSNIAQWAADYLECVELDRFQAFATEQELETAAGNLHSSNSLLAGIVFTDVPDSREKRQASTTVPQHIGYKIRMNIDSVTQTRVLKDRMWRPQPEDQFNHELRYFRGFIQLQDLVDKSIIAMQTGGGITHPSVTTQQFPFPCHVLDVFVNVFGGYGLPLVMTISWIIIISVAVNFLVYDREAGQEENLKAMGMISVLNWWAWFLTTMVILAVMDAVVCGILFGMKVFNYSSFAIIYLYILDFLFSTLMLSYFISAFFTRPAMAILASLIVYILSYLPYVILITLETEMTFWQKSLACLSSTTSFSFSAIFIARYEETQIGLQWDNINVSPIHGEDFTFSWGCIMMLIDAIIYLVLGYYVRNVKPGKWGLSQPWYFIICPQFWCNLGSSRKPNSQALQQDAFSEAVTTDTPVVMSVRGLVKEFKKGEKTVNNLSLDIRGSSVTTLLGHNGAAKTTTMKMLIGQLEPTAGEVTVFGKPVSEMSGSVGICPQHNALYEYMTVEEHMKFYSAMKNNPKILSDKQEIEKLLTDVDMWHCRHQRVTELSGGMQRRLCVALAFVGGSKLVILDEPTSGIDPSGRRAIWNLILKQKYDEARKDVAVLLSTHHLDEADMISDQVVIIHNGRMLAQGSPIFLKHNFSTGHRLTVTMDTDSNPDPSRIFDRLRSWVPEARIQQVYGHESQFVLPPLSIGTFYDMFTDLENHRQELGIMSYGVSDPTLEEVFMKVCSVADSGATRVTPEAVKAISNEPINGTTTHDKEKKSEGSDSSFDSTRRIEIEKGGSLFLSQIKALFTKRFHHFRRDYRMLLVILLLPLLLFLAASGFYSIKPDATEAPSLVLTPALYGPNTHMFFKSESTNNQANAAVDSFMHNPGVSTTCMDGVDFGKQFQCVTPDSGFTEESLEKINGTCRCDDFKYVCDQEPAVNHPRHMKTTTTDILQDLAGKDVSPYLLHSFHSYTEKRYGGWVISDVADPSRPADVEASIWFNNKGHHSLPSYYNAYSNGWLRSLVGGDPSQYGITTYNHPFLFDKEQLTEETMLQSFADIGIAFTVVVAFTFIPAGALLYIVSENIRSEKQLQRISGVGTVLYWFCSLFWDMLLYGVGVGVAVIIMAIFQHDVFWERENTEGIVVLMFLFGFACLSLMYCTSRYFKDVATAFFVMFCTLIIVGIAVTLIMMTLEYFIDDSEQLEKTNRVLNGIFMVIPTYAFGNGLIHMIANQVRTEIFERFNTDVYLSPFDLDLIGWNMIALAIEGGVFFILTLLLDIRCRSSTHRFNNPFSEEEDVARESRRIEQGHSVDDVILVNNLHKVYKGSSNDVHAVNGLSFGVQVGECFGLLGVNGAGKTTTFNILTGVIDSTEGDAVIMGRRRHKGLSQMGYCPQEDALDPYLSIVEMLYFHSKLKGIVSGKRNIAVNSVMEKLDLLNIQNKLVKNCSGGMKRKLCLAIALLGDPEVVLLDEPTTGMDPKAKRLVWDYLLSAKDKGMSIILTSHSMEECDIMCDRIGIMVNGRFKCLGSSQHLKEKYGSGYTVKLCFSGLSTTSNMINELIDNFFPTAVVRECHQSVLQLDVPRDTYRLTDLLQILEKEKDKYNIVYYTVAQTTLDTVFLNFAREQTENLSEESSPSGSAFNVNNGSTDRQLLYPRLDKGGDWGSKRHENVYDNKVTEEAALPVAFRPKSEDKFNSPFVHPVTSPEEIYPQIDNKKEWPESTRL